MITNKDIRVDNGNLVLNGDKYPLDGQSPEAIMKIVKDNSDSTPTAESTNPVTSGGVYTAIDAVSDDVEGVASGLFAIPKTDISASSVDDFLVQALADIKAVSNANNNASINRMYGWVGVDQYVIQALRMTPKWIYAFVFSYDRAYIIEYNCNDDTIASKKTFTLT